MEMIRHIKRVGIIGHFAEGLDMADGQIVKTRTVRELLRDVCGNENVHFVDTRGWQKHPFALLRKCSELAKFADVLVMLPAHNGVKIFAPLLVFLRNRYGCKAVYSVVGGWLAEFIAGQSFLTKKLKSFDAILVESDRVKNLLIEQGFDNVLVVYNYKRLPLLESSELERPSSEPWPLAVFSRIYEDKDIDDVVWAVREANGRLGRIAFKLDIYGNVLPEYKEHFDALIAGCDISEVAYKGVAPAGESTSVLNGYLALAFPTRCPGEGVPGTVVDAYCAGIPVIASQWLSYAEMIKEGETGVTYEFFNRDAFIEIYRWPISDCNGCFQNESTILWVHGIVKRDNSPADYKVSCFNGVPKLIEVHRGRFSNHTCDYFTPSWDSLPDLEWDDIPKSNYKIPAPSRLHEMLNYSSVLTEGFPEMRADWYLAGDRLIFGELTLFSDGGFGAIDDANDFLLGSFIDLGLAFGKK